MPHPNLLTINRDAKTSKGVSVGYLTGCLYMSPYWLDTTRARNLCPNSTPGCRSSCLVHTGRLHMLAQRAAQRRKKQLYLNNRNEFKRLLWMDLGKLTRWAELRGLIPACRLNGTTDVDWITTLGRYWFREWHDVQFYDYTKRTERYASSLWDTNWPDNYKLVYSRSESNEPECEFFLRHGGSVAVTFYTNRRKGPLPEEWTIGDTTATVVDGDVDDAWFSRLRPGQILGLRAKGIAKKDTTGFVVRP